MMSKKQNVSQDLDLKELEQEIEKERIKTTTIFRHFVDGLLYIEQDKITFINDKAKEFFSIEEPDVLGKTLSSLKTNENIGVLVQTLESKTQPFARTVLELSETLVLNVSIAPVIHKRQTIGKIVILHDITRERMFERMKTEFVSISAHQLRTPLSAVKWILRMILDGDLGKVPKNQRDFLERTYKSNERMIQPVNDLLNVSRIEEGRFLYNLQSKDLSSIVEKIVVPFAILAEKKGLQFEYKKPKTKIPKIKMDTEKMILAVQALIDNAVNYTKTGGIMVSVKFLKDENNILFSVKDTGIGIQQNQQKRVFERFFRSSDAIKTETEGTGLGLFIAKNVVEAHGGRAWFESKENKGSTFYFTLPTGKQKLINGVIKK